jgi:GT2 family glycosyltransferase
VYLDADVRLPGEWLEKVFEYFKTHPQVSAVSCDFRFYDGTKFQNISQRFFDSLIMPVNNTVMRLLSKPEVLIGQSIALRTAWLRKAGGINTDFVFHGEDTSLAYRMHSQGKVKFLRNLYVYSSARRYQREGLVRTLFAYWTTYWLLTLGKSEKAERFANKHNPN